MKEEKTLFNDAYYFSLKKISFRKILSDMIKLIDIIFFTSSYFNFNSILHCLLWFLNASRRENAQILLYLHEKRDRSLFRLVLLGQK